MAGVKNVVVKKHNLPSPQDKAPFSDGIVFVVGGGNYIEYQNLQDYVKTKNVGYTGSASKFRIIKVTKF